MNELIYDQLAGGGSCPMNQSQNVMAQAVLDDVFTALHLLYAMYCEPDLNHSQKSDVTHTT